MNYEKELNELKSNIEKANRFKIRAESRLEELNHQKSELLKELEKYGIMPENLDSEIKKLEEEIQKDIEEANRLLPKEILENLNE